ncbi:ArsR/SmtB family transcription factor [Salinilacihabitans rarus]|uniref:ArsR/SmtB family transcription factor n=1 Tax=Salinilacihabitans rarus TaxID=2961596 RepID=UPI0020C88B88|nr:winged helix-turn-helix domain-containing protein [Salinilacihabitans rarus]
MTESHLVEELDPEDAFAVLSDGTRIDILRALWETDGGEATFSELRDAVGMRDSGKFNYHLGKLTGRFVDRTDEGYELRSAGRHVVGSLLAGGFTMTADVDPIALDDPCPVCGADLAFAYEDERVRIDCEACPYGNSFPVPPGAFAECPVDRFPAVANRYLRTLLARARNEFCAACEGRVRPDLTTFDALETDRSPAGFGSLVAVVYDCDRCGMSTQVNLSTILLDHPLVSAFHYEHGTDVRDVPLWRLGVIDGEPQSRLLDGDAGAARATYAVGERELSLTVDESLTVLDADRS